MKFFIKVMINALLISTIRSTPDCTFEEETDIIITQKVMAKGIRKFTVWSEYVDEIMEYFTSFYLRREIKFTETIAKLNHFLKFRTHLCANDLYTERMQTPCGGWNFYCPIKNRKDRNSKTQWQIRVQKVFATNLTFLIFDYYYSGPNCEGDHLLVSQYRQYCGKRPQWSIYHPSNKVILTSYSPSSDKCKFSINYNVLDKNKCRTHIEATMEPNIYVINTTMTHLLPNNLFLRYGRKEVSNKYFTSHTMSVRTYFGWKLTLQLSKVINGLVKIFEGPSSKCFELWKSSKQRNTPDVIKSEGFMVYIMLFYEKSNILLTELYLTVSSSHLPSSDRAIHLSNNSNIVYLHSSDMSCVYKNKMKFCGWEINTDSTLHLNVTLSLEGLPLHNSFLCLYGGIQIFQHKHRQHDHQMIESICHSDQEFAPKWQSSLSQYRSLYITFHRYDISGMPAFDLMAYVSTSECFGYTVPCTNPHTDHSVAEISHGVKTDCDTHLSHLGLDWLKLHFYNDYKCVAIQYRPGVDAWFKYNSYRLYSARPVYTDTHISPSLHLLRLSILYEGLNIINFKIYSSHFINVSSNKRIGSFVLADFGLSFNWYEFRQGKWSLLENIWQNVIKLKSTPLAYKEWQRTAHNMMIFTINNTWIDYTYTVKIYKFHLPCMDLFSHYINMVNVQSLLKKKLPMMVVGDSFYCVNNSIFQTIFPSLSLTYVHYYQIPRELVQNPFRHKWRLNWFYRWMYYRSSITFVGKCPVHCSVNKFTFGFKRKLNRFEVFIQEREKEFIDFFKQYPSIKDFWHKRMVTLSPGKPKHHVDTLLFDKDSVEHHVQIHISRNVLNSSQCISSKCQIQAEIHGFTVGLFAKTYYMKPILENQNGILPVYTINGSQYIYTLFSVPVQQKTCSWQEAEQLCVKFEAHLPNFEHIMFERDIYDTVSLSIAESFDGAPFVFINPKWVSNVHV